MILYRHIFLFFKNNVAKLKFLFILLHGICTRTGTIAHFNCFLTLIIQVSVTYAHNFFGRVFCFVFPEVVQTFIGLGFYFSLKLSCFIRLFREFYFLFPRTVHFKRHPFKFKCHQSLRTIKINV